MSEALPADRRPPRLEPLNRLPIFFDLSGRNVLLAGGGHGAAWKAELLAAAGARVTVVAVRVDTQMQEMIQTLSLTWHQREWVETDFSDVALAIGQMSEDVEAERFSAAARSRGVPVNVIDRPAFCDFQFGTIVNRSPVVVAINTDGAAPVLGQAIRRRIEAILPQTLASWAQAAKEFRRRLPEVITDFAHRRLFWEKLVDLAFSATPEKKTLEELAQHMAITTQPPQGEVILVGTGPGDPELVTLKAMRAMQAADVLVYDRLVTPEILELGRREARRIHVGKQGFGVACTQSDINTLLIDLARQGQRVVRLKGGDPAIFGRAGEEISACRAAGVQVTMIPGITSASAAAAALTLSLTHRDHAQRLQFITGHDRHGHLPQDINLAALADPNATTVVYMGRTSAGTLAKKLLAEGLDAATPVCVIQNISLSRQEARQVSLGQLAEGITHTLEPNPTLLLVGQAIGHLDALPTKD